MDTLNELKQYLDTIPEPEVRRLFFAFVVVGLCVKCGMSKEEIMEEMKNENSGTVGNL